MSTASEHRLSPEGRYKCATVRLLVSEVRAVGMPVGETEVVFVVHGTQRFLERVRGPVAGPLDGTTLLGPWYATVARWRPQTALFVSEATCCPRSCLSRPHAAS